MSDPQISVVLPTYDAAFHVRGAIRSLREQTLTDFEVVVVDDGSTDGTLDIVRRVSDDRFRVVERDDPTGGLPGALNRGVWEARAPYVARQDADDQSHPHRLEEQVDFLDENPDVALVGTGARILRTDGTVKDVRRTKPQPTFPDLLEKNHFVHGSVAFRRGIVRELGGYDERFEFSEDYDLWLRLARRHAVRNLKAVRYDLRLHGESIYGAELETVKLYAAFARARALNNTSLTAEEVHGDPRCVYREFTVPERARFHREMAQALLRYGERADARSHARRGLCDSPTDPRLWVFLALSVAPSRATDAAVWAARRLSNVRAR
ncbi:glycosyltransferase involved in cell wall biosynthesis [Halarchaeum rubridurum]|uniref:Glycosyltransferase involved in cell wall biosynthesis n=1 Tax=Halarchaeum rubridurum TaxID=489911 RepID=A0A830FS12_9EURY|nr:glycosyltransferase [Halarchaeum rubridurum]MBP1953343.1 glycosyltransferase involved in cell wall biosynthesis [Halarchaeum rubridurum]GGM66060.1 hypothetical protein GCM10009017_15150 [Halarchaeum rubridurum]